MSWDDGRAWLGVRVKVARIECRRLSLGSLHFTQAFTQLFVIAPRPASIVVDIMDGSEAGGKRSPTDEWRRSGFMQMAQTHAHMHLVP